MSVTLTSKSIIHISVVTIKPRPPVYLHVLQFVDNLYIKCEVHRMEDCNNNEKNLSVIRRVCCMSLCWKKPFSLIMSFKFLISTYLERFR